MKNTSILCLSSVVLATSLSAVESGVPTASRDYPVCPVPTSQVHLNDIFWKPRIDINSRITVPACFKKCEQTRLPNFRRAAKLQDGAFQGDPFDDSDLYKVAEGAAYSLAAVPNPELHKYLDDVVALLGKAQQPDGYLYTSRIIHGDKAPGRAGPVRWLNEMGGVTGDDSHELYNAGHLIEAAVAHYQTTNHREFLDIAIRLADLIDKTWGPGPDQLKISPGHQEIELALVKLGRATGEQKYLTLAKFLLDCRGHYRRPADIKPAFPDAYYSNEVPLTNLTKAVGHAVRTGYMLSGMTDIAALFADPAYTKAVDAVWDDTVGSKLYLHGGIGSGVGTSEGFGNAHEMPNNGYNETCAAISNCLWNHRMFLLHGDAKYIDVLERTLYNGFLSGVSLSGDHFFYPNPLVSKGGYARREWFGCACCPVNVSRFLPSVPGLQYAVHADQLYVNLYAAGMAETSVAATRVKLTQETRYPWDGAVKLSVAAQQPTRFTVRLRIPGWARNQPVPTDLYRNADAIEPTVSLTVNGEPQDIQLQKGYVALTRVWKQDDVIALNLAMPVRRVVASDKVADDAGRVALERGPVVYCFEGIDHKDKVFSLVVADDTALASTFRADLLGGVAVITGEGSMATRQADGSVTSAATALTAVPYYAWCNRGAGQMQVWMPRELAKADPSPLPEPAK
ncbi:MAG: glycoside hydrolase family 127 protein [Verrucomicrobia bacterium]|nr:MAG: glycoside hydrolase family 127 protein [Verrucomicrobiota bacterium]